MIYIHIEGIFFYENILDTEDISTIRGGSMLLETLGERVETELSQYHVKLVEYGASKAVLECAIDDKDEIETALLEFVKKDPDRHLALAWGTAKLREAEEPQDAKKRAKARFRKHQYQTATVPWPNTTQDDYFDQLDLTRPATHKDDVGRFISARNLTFRNEGRKNRPQFNLKPPQSFHDILANPPASVSDQVKNKLAVVYADGSGLGKIQRDNPDQFSQIMDKNRKELAERLEDWLVSLGDFGMNSTRPRFDVLIWGGDDITFVMPAWLLFPFVETFAEQTRKWTFSGGHVSHRISAVIAHYKTPIRQMRNLVAGGEQLIKDAGLETSHSMMSVDVFESSPLPFDTLLKYRQHLYGDDYRLGSDVLDAEDLPDFKALVDRKIGDDASEGKISRTQLHRVLEGLRSNHRPICASGSADVALDNIASYFERLTDLTSGSDALFDKNRWREDFTSKPQDLALRLAQVAQLLPYLDAIAPVWPVAGDGS